MMQQNPPPPPIQLPSLPRYLSVDTIHQIGQAYLLKYGDPSIPTSSQKHKWYHFCCHRDDPNQSALQKRWALWAINFDANTFDQQKAWYELANLWRAGTYDVFSGNGHVHYKTRVELFLAKYAKECFQSAFGIRFDNVMPVEEIYNSLNANIDRAYHHELKFKVG